MSSKLSVLPAAVGSAGETKEIAELDLYSEVGESDTGAQNSENLAAAGDENASILQFQYRSFNQEEETGVFWLISDAQKDEVCSISLCAEWESLATSAASGERAVLWPLSFNGPFH